MIRYIIAGFLILWASTAWGAEWYVSSSVTDQSGAGTIGSPWGLLHAIGHDGTPAPGIAAGDTIYLRGGTYRSPDKTGGITSMLSGTSGNRITVRPYPGEVAKIDLWDLSPGVGGDFLDLALYGNYTDYIGLEILNSNTTIRYTTEPDHNLGNAIIGRGQININGTDNRVINCIVHDLNLGIGFWKEATGGELYGNIIYNNGWDTPTTNQWDNAIYTQNFNTATKLYTDNIVFNGFAFGIAAYGGASGPMQKMTFRGNILFQNGVAPGVGSHTIKPDFLVGGTLSAGDIIIDRNYSYQTGTGSFQIGYEFGGSNANVTVTNNYLYSGNCNWPKPWSSITASGNTVKALTGASAPGFGFTVNASPTGTFTVARPNVHESGRGHVAIFNWNGSSSVNVDLSSVVAVGSAYQIYHVYDLATPVTSGTYSGGAVSIPMAAKNPPVILGDITDLGTPVQLPNTFGAFLVTSQGAPAATYYVSTTGGTGTGSINDPWSLAYAWDSDNNGTPALNPGDTVLIRGGTYATGHIACYQDGAAGNHVTFAGYPGEKVKIDVYNGTPHTSSTGWWTRGDYCIFKDFEIYSSDPNARKKTGVPWRGSVDLNGIDNRFHNIIMHDFLNVGWWKECVGGEWNGCLVYNVGGIDNNDPAPQGHSCYTQNNNGNIKTMRDCMLFNSFGWNLHAYGGSAGPLHDYTFIGNLFFHAGKAHGLAAGGAQEFLIGGTLAADDIVLTNNYAYSTTQGFGVGYDFGGNNTKLTMTGNYLYPSTVQWPKPWSSITASGNTVRAQSGTNIPSSGFTVNGSPTGQNIVVRPSTITTGRGNLYIFNWADTTSASVNLSSIVPLGWDYKIHHAYDLVTPVLSGNYGGGNVTVPLASKSPPALLGGTAGLGTPIALPRQFGAFLVTSEASTVPAGEFASASISTGGQILSITWDAPSGVNWGEPRTNKDFYQGGTHEIALNVASGTAMARPIGVYGMTNGNGTQLQYRFWLDTVIRSGESVTFISPVAAGFAADSATGRETAGISSGQSVTNNSTYSGNRNELNIVIYTPTLAANPMAPFCLNVGIDFENSSFAGYFPSECQIQWQLDDGAGDEFDAWEDGVGEPYDSRYVDEVRSPWRTTTLLRDTTAHGLSQTAATCWHTGGTSWGWGELPAGGYTAYAMVECPNGDVDIPSIALTVDAANRTSQTVTVHNGTPTGGNHYSSLAAAISALTAATPADIRVQSGHTETINTEMNKSGVSRWRIYWDGSGTQPIIRSGKTSGAIFQFGSFQQVVIKGLRFVSEISPAYKSGAEIMEGNGKSLCLHSLVMEGDGDTGQNRFGRFYDATADGALLFKCVGQEFENYFVDTSGSDYIIELGCIIGSSVREHGSRTVTSGAFTTQNFSYAHTRAYSSYDYAQPTARQSGDDKKATIRTTGGFGQAAYRVRTFRSEEVANEDTSGTITVSSANDGKGSPANGDGTRYEGCDLNTCLGISREVNGIVYVNNRFPQTQNSMFLTSGAPVNAISKFRYILNNTFEKSATANTASGGDRRAFRLDLPSTWPAHNTFKDNVFLLHSASTGFTSASYRIFDNNRLVWDGNYWSHPDAFAFPFLNSGSDITLAQWNARSYVGTDFAIGTSGDTLTSDELDSEGWHSNLTGLTIAAGKDTRVYQDYYGARRTAGAGNSLAGAITTDPSPSGGTVPVISNPNGGTSPAAVSSDENTATSANITTITTSAGDEPMQFELSGDDAAAFVLASAGTTARHLRWATSPNFEAPTDTGANNVYDVTVTVSNAAGNDTLDIDVTVNDVAEGGVGGGPSDYLARWKLDETSGSTADNAQGNAARDGTLSNFSLPSAWQNPGLLFDGSNDVVAAGGGYAQFQYNDPFTICGWYKPTAASPTAGEGVINMNNNSFWGRWNLIVAGAVANDPYRFIFGQSDSLRIIVDGARTNTTKVRHVAVTYSGSGIASGVKIYENGVNVTGATQDDDLGTPTLSYSGQVVRMGFDDANDVYLNGMLRDWQIFDRELTAEEVRLAAAAGVGKPTDPVTWYKLDETTGTTFVDSGSEAINATSFGLTDPDDYLNPGINFDGTNNRLEASGAAQFVHTNPFSARFKFRSNATPTGTEMILSTRDASGFGYYFARGNATNKFYLALNQATGQLKVETSAAVTHDTNWHEYCITYDGSQTPAGITIYRNGLQLVPATASNTLGTPTWVDSNFLVTGSARPTTNDFPLNGDLRDVMIFNRELSVVEQLAFAHDLSGFVNADPVFIGPTSFAINENTTAVGTVSFTDIDGHTVAITEQTDTDNVFTVADNGNSTATITIASRDFEALAAGKQFSLTVRGNDGNGGIVDGVVTVTVLDVDEGLIVHWDFDNDGDDLQNHAEATAVGATFSAADPAVGTHNAVLVASESDHFTTTYTNGLGTSYSISCWVKFTGTGVYTFFAHYDRGSNERSCWLGSAANASGKVELIDSDSGLFPTGGGFSGGDHGVYLRSSVVINDGNWHHVAVTRNTTTAVRKMYIDGALDGSATTLAIDLNMGPLFVSGDPWLIGARFNVSPTLENYMDGELDEMKIFDLVLTESEVQTLFADGSAETPNSAPVITSNGGGDTAAINRNEGDLSTITTVTATDADLDPITYTISGGVDSNHFFLDGQELKWALTPNYEDFADNDSENTFEVIVRASDGTAFDEQTITVTVINLPPSFSYDVRWLWFVALGMIRRRR